MQALDLLISTKDKLVFANTSQNLHCMPVASHCNPFPCMTPSGKFLGSTGADIWQDDSSCYWWVFQSTKWILMKSLRASFIRLAGNGMALRAVLAAICAMLCCADPMLIKSWLGNWSECSITSTVHPHWSGEKIHVYISRDITRLNIFLLILHCFFGHRGAPSQQKVKRSCGFCKGWWFACFFWSSSLAIANEREDFLELNFRGSPVQPPRKVCRITSLKDLMVGGISWNYLANTLICFAANFVDRFDGMGCIT